MVKQQQRRAVPLCMAVLMVFLVVSAMHAVPAEAAGIGIRLDPLDPNRPTVTVPPGMPYTPGMPMPHTRPCLYKNDCQSHEP